MLDRKSIQVMTVDKDEDNFWDIIERRISERKKSRVFYHLSIPSAIFRG